jgi:TatD DNase family protein
MISYIDTHIHIDAPEAIFSVADFLRQAHSASIKRFLVPGVKPENWNALLTLAQANPTISIAPGVHPFYADNWSTTVAQHLRLLAKHVEVVAIGEIGLDAIMGPDSNIQQRAFREQLEIACTLGLPILLHSRKKTPDTIQILKDFSEQGLVGGIWHGFSGSGQTAEQLLKLGLKIGVGTLLLKDSARKLPEVIQQFPLESFVLETDYPYRADHPKKLLDVAAKVAQLKKIPIAEVAAVTTNTAKHLFIWERAS